MDSPPPTQRREPTSLVVAATTEPGPEIPRSSTTTTNTSKTTNTISRRTRPPCMADLSVSGRSNTTHTDSIANITASGHQHHRHDQHRQQIQPLRDQRFFVHLNRIRVDERELEDVVARLGGTVDRFFTGEVTCVLTDDRSVARTGRGWWEASVPSASSPHVRAADTMCRSSAAESKDKRRLPRDDDEDLPTGGPPPQSVERLAARLKSTTTASRESLASTAQPTGIVNKAKALGIRVCHVKDFVAWVRTQHSPSSSSSSVSATRRFQTTVAATARSRRHQQQQPNRRKRMVHKLCGPIVKVEDSQSIYKPFYKELKKDPALLLEPYHTGSPYDDLEAIHASATHVPVKKQRDDAKATLMETVAATNKCVVVGRCLTMRNNHHHRHHQAAQPKNQYCECCREFFCDLPKHLDSDKHREFVSQQRNFECLREFVDCFPGLVVPTPVAAAQTHPQSRPLAQQGTKTKIKVELPPEASLPESPPTDSPGSESVVLVVKTEPPEDNAVDGLPKVSDSNATVFGSIGFDCRRNAFKSSVPVESPLQLKLPLCASVNVNVFPTPSPSSSPLQCVNATTCKKEDGAASTATGAAGPASAVVVTTAQSTLAKVQYACPVDDDRDATFPSFPYDLCAEMTETTAVKREPALEPDFLSSPIPIDDLPSPPSDTPVLLEWPDFMETKVSVTAAAHELSSSSFTPGNATLSQGLPSISHFGQEQELFKCCSAENMFSSESSDNNMTGDIQNILDGVLFNLHDRQAREHLLDLASTAAKLPPQAREEDWPEEPGHVGTSKNVWDPPPASPSSKEEEVKRRSPDGENHTPGEREDGNHAMDTDHDDTASEKCARISDEILEQVNVPEPLPESRAGDDAVEDRKDPLPDLGKSGNVEVDNGDDRTMSDETKTSDDAADQGGGVKDESTSSANKEEEPSEERVGECGYRDPPCLVRVEQQPFPAHEQPNRGGALSTEQSADPPTLEQVSSLRPSRPPPTCNDGRPWPGNEKRWSEDKEPPVLRKASTPSSSSRWTARKEEEDDDEEEEEESDPDDPYRFVDEDDAPQKETSGRRRRQRRNLRSGATTFKSGRSRRTHTRALRRACAAQITIPVYSPKRRLGLQRGGGGSCSRLVGEGVVADQMDRPEAKAEERRRGRPRRRDGSLEGDGAAVFRWHVHRIQDTKLIIRRSLVTEELL